ncbi:hypothetical protein HMPREF9123_0012 [Neisseria bacilliformis ATCC BAA-1200]|uniref:Uncharacterized protein n=1 Tax=Neisseria bacilliformis ATCC BAA-1200 TaxID=888742 RepID=F2B8J2_9NEIS|nr:hypothetical protein HMPREF9123_0012 [Neisseria bacilliformis ATCC BAA-1200]
MIVTLRDKRGSYNHPAMQQFGSFIVTLRDKRGSYNKARS